MLKAAEGVLVASGFSVVMETFGPHSTPWLLAESDLFALAALVVSSPEELERMISLATDALLERLGGPRSGAKRWDAYLVLFGLPSANLGAASRELIGVKYDTHGLRRLVPVDVVPSQESIEDALRVFLPLPPPMDDRLADVFDALIDRIRKRRFTGLR